MSSISPKGTVLITGCSPGGIGHALARTFHATGFRVFATARNSDALDSLTSFGIEAFSLEVTSSRSISDLRREISDRTGGSLDILVNNAGRNYTCPALDIDMDEVHSTFNTNVIAVMSMCKEFGPLLVKAKGKIVNISSIAGVIPGPFGAVYNASKAALQSYSDTLRIELAPFNVKVIAVVTGYVKSNITRTHRELPERSLYLPFEDEYNKRQTWSQTQGAMATDDYAERVLRAALSPSPPRTLWEGSKSWLVWLLLSTMPLVFWDLYLSRTFGLHKPIDYLQSHKKDS